MLPCGDGARDAGLTGSARAPAASAARPPPPAGPLALRRRRGPGSPPPPAAAGSAAERPPGAVGGKARPGAERQCGVKGWGAAGLRAPSAPLGSAAPSPRLASSPPRRAGVPRGAAPAARFLRGRGNPARALREAAERRRAAGGGGAERGGGGGALLPARGKQRASRRTARPRREEA